MSDTPESSVLLQRYRQGDAQAWQQLLDRYSQRLIAVCRPHIGPALVGQHGAEDAAQSALGSFLRGLQAGTIQVASSGELWRLLVVIALRKVAAYARRPQAAPQAEADLALAEALAAGPAPDEVAAFNDLVARLLQGLPEQHGVMLHLLLEGHSVAEVARRVGVSRRAVERVLGLFQRRARREDGSAAPEKS